mgnify:CR=1 FL=1
MVHLHVMLLNGQIKGTSLFVVTIIFSSRSFCYNLPPSAAAAVRATVISLVPGIAPCRTQILNIFGASMSVCVIERTATPLMVPEERQHTLFLTPSLQTKQTDRELKFIVSNDGVPLFVR